MMMRYASSLFLQRVDQTLSNAMAWLIMASRSRSKSMLSKRLSDELRNMLPQVLKDPSVITKLEKLTYNRGEFSMAYINRMQLNHRAIDCLFAQPISGIGIGQFKANLCFQSFLIKLHILFTGKFSFQLIDTGEDRNLPNFKAKIIDHAG